MVVEYAVSIVLTRNCTTIFLMLYVTDTRFITGITPKWIEVGAKLECNGNADEVYLESSRGKVPTLSECKASCESAQGCKSISYFESGWCSHWGSPCKNTKDNKKVVISLQLTYVADVKKESDVDGDKLEFDSASSGDLLN